MYSISLPSKPKSLNVWSISDVCVVDSSIATSLKSVGVDDGDEFTDDCDSEFNSVDGDVEYVYGDEDEDSHTSVVDDDDDDDSIDSVVE